MIKSDIRVAEETNLISPFSQRIQQKFIHDHFKYNGYEQKILIDSYSFIDRILEIQVMYPELFKNRMHELRRANTVRSTKETSRD